MMQLQSYPKIPESLSSSLKLDERQTRLLQRTQWVVTEKIHGAHFVWLCDGRTISCAKRKSLLQEGEDFFGHQRLIDGLTAPLMALYQRLHEAHPTLTHIAVHGELFGGDYPHPDVPPVPHTQPVQTGIYYAPHIAFCAFDLALFDKKHKRRWLPYLDAITHFEAAGVPFVPPLLVGSYQDALAFDPHFPTTIPALWSLPPLPENPAEGVVLKPTETLTFESTKGLVRPIIKHKIPRFAEDQRFHQAQKWAPTHTPTHTPLEWELIARVTPTRLDNVLSKWGHWRAGDKDAARQIFRLFQEDVWESLVETQGELLHALPSHQQQRLRKRLQEETQKLFATHSKAKQTKT